MTRATPALVLAAIFATATATVAEEAAASEPEATTTQTADELAEKGFAAYQAGQFADAVGLYMHSFQISGDARILYNVASIYDKKLHDRALAEDFYRRYLRSTTTEPDLVKKANERLVELKNQEETLKLNADARATAPAPAPVVAPVVAPPAERPRAPEGSPWRIGGLVAVGAGAVGLAVGGVYGLTAMTKNDRLDTRCPGGACIEPGGEQLRDDAASAATVSTVAFVAGGVLVAGGLALVFLAPKTARAGLRLSPVAGGRSGVLVGGTF